MNRVVVVAGLAVMLGLASNPAAQSPAGPAFEVASVKPSNPDAAGPRGMPVGGRFNASNVTLRELVLRAYELFDSQLDGGPDWQTSRRFDIQAKAKDPVAGMTAMLPMLKTLLADRFKLKVHTERREMPIYALVVARDNGQLGPNITRSTADCSNAERELAETSAKAGPGAVLGLLQKGQGLPCAIMPVPARVSGSMTMRANGSSMAELARFLTPATGRIVQDRTGLSGLYDWEITYDPRLLQAAPGSDGPSLIIALQEQLGLKLESTRGPVEILVIDSAALPEPD
ncbi:MAG TPA: TIGR03435 family protein [Gemmatimonadales bacterium]|nr:TIGR03435 family protein [Gemmatimonadales bacterium]